ncbi:type ISP restriction/modification enzyme [Acetobacter orleanensis]|uniref:Type ISP restriction-modification enzyme LLaBIII C-terminal specificity domain-containing protein n=1 Tax=Acetobacter orleanensis TaxID=104099 RepID=A0A4Y3TM59_9PROT|nr:type ISP restriction/modification enzyme [Acetobacter orleanensis]GAN69687.1 helicase [Acetobacter orleanensis JCM 7639]GBR31605.1 DNA helicase restriction enzyme type III R subunit [Acetobacter orleanensis NRIC 0473]GEB84101.1 hypothetical protein AOR01nite_25780 [Acetobacter orleanensis]
MDPFTGTGTFITRLLQSGLITKEQLLHKYQQELHANEIVLLAYYIASINIEATFSGLMDDVYEPFEGICLTDTFRLNETHDLIGSTLEDNNKRIRKQRKLDIRVIMGNPPYSVGQTSGNDNNQNVSYPALDSRIARTYAERSSAINKRALYDSYIRAIRWASDRIGNCGVIGFVTNAGFLDANTANGLRQCLTEEFSSIHVVHLRGGVRGKSGDLAKREGGNIFDIMVAPAISIMVKNPDAKEQGRILFHDIGDYLTCEQKLKRIQELASLNGLTDAGLWQTITPDEHGDWLRQRDDSFGKFIAIGSKEKDAGLVLFDLFSRGVATARDAWCYNSSHQVLTENMLSMIDVYNSERQRFRSEYPDASSKERSEKSGNFVDNDSCKISWNRSLLQDFARDKPSSFQPEHVVQSVYRPFFHQWMYFDRQMNDMIYQMPRLFPDAKADNLAIVTSGTGGRSAFTCTMTNHIPSLHMADIDGSQCFPLFVYHENTTTSDHPDLLTGSSQSGPTKQDAITDEGLKHFQDAYPGQTISKQDLFYYVYGLLHSPEYRERYADTLRKELPRIPRMKTYEAFKAFSDAGRRLGEMHVNFDSQPIYEGVKVDYGKGPLTPEVFRVKKMKYGKSKDKSILHYNDRITVTGIPLEAYDYVVNGKSALDWVVERQCVKTDKASGIVNDANDWAIETMDNPRYPLELFLRVITISLETMKIVNGLPALDILES